MSRYTTERPKMNYILDLTSLTVAEFEVPLSMLLSSSTWRIGPWTAPPVRGGTIASSHIPAADAGGPAAVPLDGSQASANTGGPRCRLWDGSVENQSVAPHLVGGAAERAIYLRWTFPAGGWQTSSTA